MMRKVRMVRFVASAGYNELWGRKVTTVRAEDGYKMRFYPESGMLLIEDAKGEGEVAVHASRCDVYLEPEEPVQESAARERAKSTQTAPPLHEETRGRAGAPQLK